MIRFPVDGGGYVLVTASSKADEENGPVRVSRGGILVKEAALSLQAALQPVREASQAVLDALKESGPDEIEVEFGLDMTAHAGAVITRVGGNCHLTVKLAWKGHATPAD